MNSSRFSLLAALAVSFAAPGLAIAPHTVRDGIEAWQRADYSAAVAIWRPLAAKGNADAAFNLGQAYRLGRGVPVDLAQAKKWLEKAALAGHLDAETTLGLLLFDSGDRDGAIAWLKKAAARGEPRAMLVYGTALFNGDSVPRDAVMAYAYVSRAAAQGLDPAKRTLADMDKILPVDVRRQALKIALQKADEHPAPASKPVETATKATTRAAQKPQLKPEQAAPAPTASAGSWRIQLGAFSKRSSAEALYAKLSASPPVAGHAPVYVPAGAVTRLQVGGFASKAAASAACAALKGQPCFPVPAR